jgi:succinate-acetate transporter protein
MTALNNSDAAPVARFADPAGLGLAGFGITTLILSLANSNLVPGAASGVFGMALFYGGIAQVIAGIWEFGNKNTFGATAFTSYGAFWLAFWFLADTGQKLDANAVGTFLLGWTIFTAYMTIAAVKSNLVILLVFIALTLTFLFLTIGAWGAGSATFTHIGGFIGIVTAILALYGSFATVINATWKRVVLPVRPAN